ncbi:MAG: cysteine hydrolase [Acidobacteria bacterium]|nr:cysteine hydrolase [Acidobacteriota bacterium]
MAVDRWAKPALLIVDMQNDFVRVGAPMEVPEARETIPQHQQLIEYFRKSHLPIVYTRFLAGSERRLLWEFSPQLEPPTLACHAGHKRAYAGIHKTLDCAAIIDEIAPKPEDAVIDKLGYGAFHRTKLDDTLRKLAVESLVVTGTVTQICVEETAREAFHYGYKTTLVSDAVSSYLPDLHAATLKNFALKFGWVSTTREVLGAMQSQSTGARLTFLRG